VLVCFDAVGVGSVESGKCCATARGRPAERFLGLGQNAAQFPGQNCRLFSSAGRGQSLQTKTLRCLQILSSQSISLLLFLSLEFFEPIAGCFCTAAVFCNVYVAVYLFCAFILNSYFKCEINMCFHYKKKQVRVINIFLSYDLVLAGG